MPVPLIDPADYPLDQILMDRAAIDEWVPHRHEFQQLTSVLHLDLAENLIVAHRHVGNGEFWERGHVPGRPILPGVLMMEAIGQAATIHLKQHFGQPAGTFFGLLALEKARFRAQVHPGTDVLVAGRVTGGSVERQIYRYLGQLIGLEGGLICEISLTAGKF